MKATNGTENGTQNEQLSRVFSDETHWIYFSAVNILLSVTAFLGNSLILVALHKESSLHPPSKLLYRSLATTDLCVGLVCQPLSVAIWMTSDAVRVFGWSRYRYLRVASFVTGYTLCSVSLLTLSAISVDRVLALSLGMRYRQVVTLKQTYVVVATFWGVSIVAAALHLVDRRITFWYTFIGIPLCLAISIASYAKVFHELRHHHNQNQAHAQQQPSQHNILNMARYRKAVYSALWVQVALVICYLPFIVIASFFADDLSWVLSVTLVYFNSSLNPFLYCWKIGEVRQAVKETIRQALCFA